MKKIMKRLLTGVLTLATVFTALPVTQVHAADSVYTTTDGKAGTIVKIDNGGSEVSSFEESIMNADGQIAYCIDINTNFQSGYKNRINATERMSDDQISDVALNLEYVKQYAEKHSLSSKQVYLLEQCVVWRRLSVHLGWGYNNVRAAYDEVSEKIQSEVYENAKAFAKENKDRYDCGGYIYVGEGQDLGQFWAKLAVGDGKIQKSSSNTAITKSNDCYSLSGATYGVYSDKGCTKSVATLMTDGNGNTDTVELRASTYYVKEIKAPKGFQLDNNVYTLTVKAGETSTLKVSDTPKVTDTLVELFKIDMETGKATAQGNASLEGAEFVWKYYDGYYTKDNLPSEPTRTWTTKTKAEKGSDNTIHYITRLADSYKVSGDSFYTQNGTICLPLGTITVEEKAAPKANVRDSDRKVLGVVTDRYKIVQNEEAFSFTDALLGEGVRYETAGSLQGGRSVWLLAHLPHEYIISGERISPYLLFSNTHDGSGAVKVAITPIRVVCSNTLNLALETAKRSWSMNHTGNVKDKMEEAKNTLFLADRYMEELGKEFENLRKITLSDKKVMDYIEILLPIEDGATPQQFRNMKRLQEDMKMRYFDAPDLKDVGKNAYRFINAVSDFATHADPLRRTRNYKENMFAKTVDGNPLIDRAYQLMLSA